MGISSDITGSNSHPNRRVRIISATAHRSLLLEIHTGQSKLVPRQTRLILNERRHRSPGSAHARPRASWCPPQHAPPPPEHAGHRYAGVDRVLTPGASFRAQSARPQGTARHAPCARARCSLRDPYARAKESCGERRVVMFGGRRAPSSKRWMRHLAARSAGRSPRRRSRRSRNARRRT